MYTTLKHIELSTSFPRNKLHMIHHSSQEFKFVSQGCMKPDIKYHTILAVNPKHCYHIKILKGLNFSYTYTMNELYILNHFNLQDIIYAKLGLKTTNSEKQNCDM